MTLEHPATKHRYITTISGVNIGPPGHFKPEHVSLHDITVSLAKMCRYNGHVDRFYSVAEHSVHVARIARAYDDEEAVLPALFHDAHEAYIGDIPSPQKTMVAGMPEFEEQMEQVVREALDLPLPSSLVWERVRLYDTMILHRELRYLRSRLPDWYDAQVEQQVPFSIVPYGLEWRDAEALFRRAMHDEGIGLGGNA